MAEENRNWALVSRETHQTAVLTTQEICCPCERRYRNQGCQWRDLPVLSQNASHRCAAHVYRRATKKTGSESALPTQPPQQSPFSKRGLKNACPTSGALTTRLCRGRFTATLVSGLVCFVTRHNLQRTVPVKALRSGGRRASQKAGQIGLLKLWQRSRLIKQRAALRPNQDTQKKRSHGESLK